MSFTGLKCSHLFPSGHEQARRDEFFVPSHCFQPRPAAILSDSVFEDRVTRAAGNICASRISPADMRDCYIFVWAAAEWALRTKGANAAADRSRPHWTARGICVPTPLMVATWRGTLVSGPSTRKPSLGPGAPRGPRGPPGRTWGPGWPRLPPSGPAECAGSRRVCLRSAIVTLWPRLRRSPQEPLWSRPRRNSRLHGFCRRETQGFGKEAAGGCMF